MCALLDVSRLTKEEKRQQEEDKRKEKERKRLEKEREKEKKRKDEIRTVSYTHLTLPTTPYV